MKREKNKADVLSCTIGVIFLIGLLIVSGLLVLIF
ncbi:small membrane protein YohP [Pacificimonas sp. ICDLI1SI03]